MTEQGEINKLKQNIIKTIYTEIFSNPFKSGHGFFKRLSAYMKLCFSQFRHPTFLLDGEPEYSIKTRGMFFPILFRLLNPFGTITLNKIEKIDRGYIAYIKEGISMLVFAVLLQLGFDEMSSKETTGNLAIAALNAIILVVFFISLIVFAGVGMFMTRKVENEKIKQKLQEIFVYECSMIFGFSVILLLMNSFGIIGSIEEGGFSTLIIMFMPPVHIFYFLTSINRRVKIANKIGILFFGIILIITGIFELLISVILAELGAGIT